MGKLLSEYNECFAEWSPRRLPLSASAAVHNGDCGGRRTGDGGRRRKKLRTLRFPLTRKTALSSVPSSFSIANRCAGFTMEILRGTKDEGRRTGDGGRIPTSELRQKKLRLAPLPPLRGESCAHSVPSSFSIVNRCAGFTMEITGDEGILQRNTTVAHDLAASEAGSGARGRASPVLHPSSYQ